MLGQHSPRGLKNRAKKGKNGICERSCPKAAVPERGAEGRDEADGLGVPKHCAAPGWGGASWQLSSQAACCGWAGTVPQSLCPTVPLFHCSTSLPSQSLTLSAGKWISQSHRNVLGQFITADRHRMFLAEETVQNHVSLVISMDVEH